MGCGVFLLATLLKHFMANFFVFFFLLEYDFVKYGFFINRIIAVGVTLFVIFD